MEDVDNIDKYQHVKDDDLLSEATRRDTEPKKKAYKKFSHRYKPVNDNMKIDPKVELDDDEEKIEFDVEPIFEEAEDIFIQGDDKEEEDEKVGNRKSSKKSEIFVTRISNHPSNDDDDEEERAITPTNIIDRSIYFQPSPYHPSLKHDPTLHGDNDDESVASSTVSGSEEDLVGFDLKKELEELNRLKKSLFEFNDSLRPSKNGFGVSDSNIELSREEEEVLKEDDEENLKIWEIEENHRILTRENLQLKRRNHNIYKSYQNELELKRQHLEIIRKLREENQNYRKELMNAYSTAKKTETPPVGQNKDNYNEIVKEYDNLLMIKKNQQSGLLRQIVRLKASNSGLKNKIMNKKRKFKNFLKENSKLIENYKHLINVVNEKNKSKEKEIREKLNKVYKKRLRKETMNYLQKIVKNENEYQERLQEYNRNYKYKKLYRDIRKENRKLKFKYDKFLEKYNELLGKYNKGLKNEESGVISNFDDYHKSSDSIEEVGEDEEIVHGDIEYDESSEESVKSIRRIEDGEREDESSDEDEDGSGSSVVDTRKRGKERFRRSFEKVDKFLEEFGTSGKSDSGKSDRGDSGNDISVRRIKKIKKKRRRRDDSRDNDKDFVFISKLIAKPDAKNYKIRKKNTYYRVVTAKKKGSKDRNLQ